MQITRQADYAVRAVLYLAHLGTSERAATSTIAEEQRIPPSFLAKIISQLSIAGLLHTSRGARGGVTLAREPQDISLLEVIEAIDGPVSLNGCVLWPDECRRSKGCRMHKAWERAQEQMMAVLDDVTLDKLAAAPQPAVR